MSAEQVLALVCLGIAVAALVGWWLLGRWNR